MLTAREFYDACVATGAGIDSHESDLYVTVTPETRALVEQYTFTATITEFRSPVDGRWWFEVPFGFIPFWETRSKVTG